MRLTASFLFIVLTFGMALDAHLSPTREHVEGAVVVRAENQPVARRRAGQLLDLFSQGRDPLARLAQRGGETLVLGHGPGQLAPNLEESFFECADPFRRIL